MDTINPKPSSINRDGSISVPSCIESRRAALFLVFLSLSRKRVPVGVNRQDRWWQLVAVATSHQHNGSIGFSKSGTVTRRRRSGRREVGLDIGPRVGCEPLSVYVNCWLCGDWVGASTGEQVLFFFFLFFFCSALPPWRRARRPKNTGTLPRTAILGSAFTNDR